MNMGNPFVHVELNTGDVKAARKFYKSLFDWKLENMKMGPGQVYTMINVGNPAKGEAAGALTQKPMPEAPTMWLSYVQVDDLDKTIKKAKKLGADVKVERIDVPDMGSLGIFVDPTGAALGVWQPAKKAARRARK
jgi:predicted enzyme related to lactoylglutathione lyase